jgi:hypothetical protein
MADIVHHAARPGGAPGEVRQAADALLGVARAAGRPRMVRAHALHLLGFVAKNNTTASALRTLMTDPEVGEDARMALARAEQK